MRVAWVADHPLFKGAIGGAEIADELMIQRRPADCEVRIFKPNDAGPHLEAFDHIVISGVYGIKDEPMKWLMNFADRATFWAHGDLTLPIYSGYMELYRAVKHMVLLTPDHVNHHRAFLERIDLDRSWEPGWFDTEDPVFTQSVEKEHFAIWPHREVWSKGLPRAEAWAKEAGVELVKVNDKPRAEVLEMMARAKWFVLLSEAFDPGPWSVMEAQLLGCNLVLSNVGMVASQPERVKTVVAGSDLGFWRRVCE